MSSLSVAECGNETTYRKSAGDIPLPGYRLIEPLGRGGFGEVWKCEAPGGLLKAIKFVPGAVSDDGGSTHQFTQEFDAFQQIKAIRHPFLLTLERVELIGDELVMVMELADRQLHDRYEECRAAGLPGIPREELLGYLGEAAEALDVIAAQYGLQHLDVKPANLFLTAGHVKVGDYGLVRPHDGKLEDVGRGLTPKYVAPEVLRGKVHTKSDQYSLALVYQELLTGTFPFTGRTAQQLMIAHVSVSPNLSALPGCDHTAVGRALAKDPDERYFSCLDFIRALLAAEFTGPTLPCRLTPPPGVNSTVTPFRNRPVDATLAANGVATPPPIAGRGKSGERSLASLSSDDDLPLAESDSGGRTRIDPVRPVAPVARLRGESVPDTTLTAGELSAAVVEVATGGTAPPVPGDICRFADGSWECRFPTVVPVHTVPQKLTSVRDRWGVEVEKPFPARIVLRKTAPAATGFWGSRSKQPAGFTLVVQLPAAGSSVGEVVVTASTFGTPDAAFAKSANDLMPQVIVDVRRELGNVADRRQDPRVAFQFPLTVYPLHADGLIDPPMSGWTRDVSASGLAFSTNEPLRTRHAYLHFAGVSAAAGLAVLVKVLRPLSKPGSTGNLYAARYETSL